MFPFHSIVLMKYLAKSNSDRKRIYLAHISRSQPSLRKSGQELEGSIHEGTWLLRGSCLANFHTQPRITYLENSDHQQQA